MQRLIPAMSAFQNFKVEVIEITGLSRDALHIYVGLGVLLIAAGLLRRPLHSVVPWLLVLAVACVGELGDMHDNISGMGFWMWEASLHDLLNTLFWPTVLCALARYQVRSLNTPL